MKIGISYKIKKINVLNSRILDFAIFLVYAGKTNLHNPLLQGLIL